MSSKEDFDILYRTYYKPLVYYALSMLKNMEEAMDIVQEVFLKYWKNRDSIFVHGNEAKYLMSMTHNRVIDKLRKANGMQKINLEEIDDAPSYFCAPSERLLEDIQSEELSAMLSREIDKLPPKCKEIFVLCRSDEVTYEQVAKQLKISVSTVKTQMVIAMKKIYSALKDYL